MKDVGQDQKSQADTPTLILDATEQILLEEGYGGVSSRKVSARAGLKSKILHYYFRTMDDLFIATFRRLEHRYFESFARAASSDRPLRELWALGCEATSARLILEFTTLAGHRPAVGELVSHSNRRDRCMMTATIETVLKKYGVDSEEFPPKVVALLMAGASRAISIERVLGTDDGHVETLAYVDRLLQRFEPLKPRNRRAAKIATEPRIARAGERAGRATPILSAGPI